MLVELEGKGTLGRRLARGVRTAIRAGRLQPGDRLPAQRVLADTVGVSRNVVVAAYGALIEEGYLESRRGAGTYVCTDLPAEQTYEHGAIAFGPAPARLSKRARRLSQAFERAQPIWAPPSRRPMIDFRYGPPGFRDLPFETFCRILGRRFRRASKSHLDYGDPAGAPPLREAIARHLGRTRGVHCDASRVIVTRGTQEAVRLAAEVLLDPGDRVIMEEPGYLAARHALSAHGAHVLRGRVDAQGLSPRAIRARSAPRMVYVTPSHQFPTGVVMPLSRRLALLERAAEVNAFLFEDDYDGELRHDGHPIPSLQGLDGDGRVVYAGSFSKSLFPALRIGYLVASQALLPAFRGEKTLADAGGNTPLQLAVADFIDKGHLERHLRRTRVANQARRAALLESVRVYFGERAEIAGAGAGHHVVLWFKATHANSAPRIRARARDLGVGIYPIAPFYAGEPPCAGFLLGYAGLTPEQIAQGIALLAKATRETA